MKPFIKVFSLAIVIASLLSCSYETFYYAYTEVNSSEAATAASYAGRGNPKPATEVIGVYVKDNSPVYVLKTNMRKIESMNSAGRSTSDYSINYEKPPVMPLYGDASKADLEGITSRMKNNSYVEPSALANYGQRLIEMFSSQEPSLRKEAKERFKVYKKYVKEHNVGEVLHYVDDIFSISS